MNRSIRIQTSVVIAASCEKIWPHLVDWENLDRWMKEGKNFRVTSSHREGTGVTAVATISIAGISTTDAIRVTEWDPPRTLEIVHLGWVSGTGRIECVAGEEGSSVRWEESLKPPLGILGAAGIRPFVPFMRRIFQRDLVLLKELVESS